MVLINHCNLIFLICTQLSTDFFDFYFFYIGIIKFKLSNWLICAINFLSIFYSFILWINIIIKIISFCICWNNLLYFFVLNFILFFVLWRWRSFQSVLFLYRSLLVKFINCLRFLVLLRILWFLLILLIRVILLWLHHVIVFSCFIILILTEWGNVICFLFLKILILILWSYFLNILNIFINFCFIYIFVIYFKHLLFICLLILIVIIWILFLVFILILYSFYLYFWFAIIINLHVSIIWITHKWLLFWFKS